jgi:peptidoglycan biosynthesis protein MviN/MurJ (putative lipid II flippase)
LGLCEPQFYNAIETPVSNYNIPIVPLGAAFFAGGIAGQLNFIMNSYSRQVKVLFDTKPMHLHPPSVRAVFNSFLPMALSFLAFQYAGDITESLLHDNVDHRQKFLVMVQPQVKDE